MAILSLFNAIVALGAYFTYHILTTIISNRRLEAFGRKNGCQPAIDATGGVFGPYKLVVRMMRMKHSGEDILDDVLGNDLKKLGPTVQKTIMGGTTVIETIEPANIQAMLATQFKASKDFELGSTRIAQFYPVLGKSIFSSDGIFWEHSRALFRPQFSRENINDLESTEHATAVLERAIGDIDSNGWTKEVDMLPLFFRFTLDTATDFLFGESVNSQAAAMENDHHTAYGRDENDIGQKSASVRFTQSFQIAGETLMWRIRLQSLYYLADGLKFRRAVRDVRNFTDYFVRRALQQDQYPEKAVDKKFNLLSTLVTQTKDREELRNQVLAIIFAGRNTTAVFLGWIFTMLAMHPRVFQKLRAHILNDFKADQPITFVDLKNCRYLQHVLNEVLRLWPIVPLNTRVAAYDTTLPIGGGLDQKSPIAVRKGQVVAYSVYLMQRREDLWGSDASEFRPERWAERRVPAWHFLPFNGGPRICIGQQFAMTEASYAVVRILQKFDAIGPAPGTEMATGARPKKILSLTMTPGSGVKIRLHKA